MKRVVSLTGIILVLVILTTTVAASLMWINTNQCLFRFYFTGSTGTIDVDISTKSHPCDIDITVKLYRKVVFIWVKDDEWNDSIYGDELSFSESFTGTVGTKYKVTLEATVTDNGVTDTISRELEGEC
jgi:hypothetical protein